MRALHLGRFGRFYRKSMAQVLQPLGALLAHLGRRVAGAQQQLGLKFGHGTAAVKQAFTDFQGLVKAAQAQPLGRQRNGHYDAGALHRSCHGALQAHDITHGTGYRRVGTLAACALKFKLAQQGVPRVAIRYRSPAGVQRPGVLHAFAALQPRVG